MGYLEIDSVQEFIEKYEERDFTNGKLSQEELDLDGSRNSNPFSYRGQFSPDLVKNILKAHADDAENIFDPFAGCGTTLHEASKLSKNAFGTEINPAPVKMASLIQFIDLEPERKKKVADKAKSLIEQLTDETHSSFSSDSQKIDYDLDLEDRVIDFVQNAELSEPLECLMINGLMRWSKRKRDKPERLVKDVKHFAEFVESLPYNDNDWGVFQTDSRSIPLESNSIDFILTSPPYINVHNYHQQYRDVIEKLGWDSVLQIAKSEMGSNRKNRRNRFLTVVQFAWDTYQVFRELERVLRDDGRMVFVIGRTSTVRGIEFKNGRFLAGVAELAGFDLVKKQERVYQNSFGTQVYEDILHFEKGSDSIMSSRVRPDELAKGIIEYNLENEEIEDDSVIEDMKEAIEEAPQQPSPLMLPSRFDKNLSIDNFTGDKT